MVEQLLIQGPAGSVQVAIDTPDGWQPGHGTAIVAHPNPAHGGNMDHKIVHTLNRAWVLMGWRAVRFNFRGVGQSEGAFDDGKGEVNDLMAVVQHITPTGPLGLSGFSFGAYVTSHAVQRLHASRAADMRSIVLVGTATSRFTAATIPSDLHHRTLALHADDDEIVPYAGTLAWAQAQKLPLLVVPGGGHFFHGQQPLLRELVLRHLRGTLTS
ncbi:alpha/beta fold hydrolase [Curvibacter sp. CHRR-16]|uniref:alpha/beta hydrolase n=1 Tax=Curvibacter sp. CHRR-16 TaxID=2835872 RepID=UPI001BD9B3EF|nr:alpha/beta fold hydrolase [Curvibacter sp. CHRR-16]MBT0571374.1 alpha/beta fold hydrolase [Curvibacter sp. CHRR-16]